MPEFALQREVLAWFDLLQGSEHGNFANYHKSFGHGTSKICTASAAKKQNKKQKKNGSQLHYVFVPKGQAA